MQNAYTTYTNTLNVSGAVDDSPVTAGTTATISYTDVLPSLSAAAVAAPTSVSEGGVGSQSVTYTFTVTNTSPASTDPVTISAIADNSGSLLAAFKAANGGSATIAYGATVSFTVSETAPDQNAGTTYVNKLSVIGQDDEGDPASTGATATIGYTDVLPSLSSTAQASVASVPEGGVPPQACDLHLHGHQHQPGDHRPGDDHLHQRRQRRQPDDAIQDRQRRQHHDPHGATVTFTVPETAPDQNAGTTYVNTLSVSGHDDENDPASTSATASISYTDVLPSLSSTAQASVASVPEGGVPPQAVTYTYTVTNTSPATTDPVTISAIDDNSGRLLVAFENANGDTPRLPTGRR